MSIKVNDLKAHVTMSNDVLQYIEVNGDPIVNCSDV
jgi:hypothetical protein